MKPITITIKPKLKWKKTDIGIKSLSGWFAILPTESKNLPYQLTQHGFNVGIFKEIVHAKAVAELIYEG